MGCMVLLVLLIQPDLPCDSDALYELLLALGWMKVGVSGVLWQKLTASDAGLRSIQQAFLDEVRAAARRCGITAFDATVIAGAEMPARHSES